MSDPADTSEGPALLAVGWAGAAVSLAFVLLRLYSRHFVSYALDWADGVVVFGWLLNIASLACCTMAVQNGLGRHTMYLSVTEINYTAYWANVLQPMGIYSYCFPKLAIVVLLVHLLRPSKTVVAALYVLMVLLFIWSFLASLFLFVRCKPHDHFWHPLEPAECMPTAVLNAITAIAGSVSAVSDLVLATFPVKVILSLQMKMPRKIGISVLMGLGVLAMAAAIIKTSMLHKESSPDATYVLIPLLIAHYIEVNLVIICATAPFLPALYSKYSGKKSTVQKSSYPRNPTETFGQGGSRGYRPFESQESAIGLHDMAAVEAADSKQGSTTTEYDMRDT